MAVFLQDDASNYVTCPYDDNHIVKKSRFSIHLLRCKSENRALFENCPFNANHIIERGKLDVHYKVCSDFHQLTKTIENNVAVPFGVNLDDQPSRPKEFTRKLQNPMGLDKRRTPIEAINNRVHWERLENPDTFTPLNMFQIQMLQKSDRKKYNSYLMRYNRKMASLGRPTLPTLSDDDDLSTLVDSDDEEGDLVDPSRFPNGREGVLTCSQLFNEARSRVVSPPSSPLLPRNRSHSVKSEVDAYADVIPSRQRDSSVTRTIPAQANAPYGGYESDASTAASLKSASTTSLGFIRKKTPIVRPSFLEPTPPISPPPARAPISSFSSIAPPERSASMASLTSTKPPPDLASKPHFSLFRKLANDSPKNDQKENTLESNQLFGSNGIKKEEPLEEEEEKFSESLNSHRTKPPSLFRGIGNRGDDHLAHQAPEVVKPPVEPSPQAPVSSGPPRYKLTLLGRRN